MILLLGCKKDETIINSKEVKETLVPVTIMTAEISDFHEYGVYYGRTRGSDRASIINISGGTVESVAVVEGIMVSKDESLGKISSQIAEIALESAKLNERINKDNYFTLKRFLVNGNSTPINVDKAHLTWLNSQAQLINALKSYNTAFCISPIAGMVVSRTINPDDEISPGQITFLIEDLSEIEIQIGIPEEDMEGIHEGSTADVTFDLYPGRIWKGELSRFSRRSSDKNLTFSAIIILDNNDGKILSGTTAKVKLLRNSYENFVVLPSDVIINDKNNDYVMVLNGNKVIKRDVILVTSNINESVIQEGVTPGESLVKEGIHLLIDSQQVRIIKEGV